MKITSCVFIALSLWLVQASDEYTTGMPEYEHGIQEVMPMLPSAEHADSTEDPVAAALLKAKEAKDPMFNFLQHLMAHPTVALDQAIVPKGNTKKGAKKHAKGKKASKKKHAKAAKKKHAAGHGHPAYLAHTKSAEHSAAHHEATSLHKAASKYEGEKAVPAKQTRDFVKAEGREGKRPKAPSAQAKAKAKAKHAASKALKARATAKKAAKAAKAAVKQAFKAAKKAAKTKKASMLVQDTKAHTIRIEPYHINSQASMNKSEKRAARSNDFEEDISENKLHEVMEHVEETVENEDDETNNHNDAVKLAAALYKCQQLKQGSYWACDRATCNYHKQCSGKKSKQNVICKREVVKHKEQQFKSKVMESKSKAQEKVNKRNRQEQRVKGKIAKEAAQKKEKVYKSPKAHAERKLKAKKERQSKEKYAKVKQRNEAQIKKWANEYGNGADVGGHWGGGELVLFPPKLKGFPFPTAHSKRKEKDAKARMNMFNNSKNCKALDKQMYNHCRSVTQQAYKKCYHVLTKASKNFRLHKAAKRMLQEW